MSREQERNELHKTIWAIANDLRGSVDGWDFKQYVLGMLFYRFISENLTNYINKEERKTGNNSFKYEVLSDEDAERGRADTVVEKGFYILPSELFSNVLNGAKNNPNLNETLSLIFNNIENSAKGTASEDDLKGLFDDLDVNSSKLGDTVTKRNERILKIMNSIDNLKLGAKKPPMPFSDTRLMSVLNHTVWFLPSVSACYAMNNLLKQRQNTLFIA